jgi:hypothetical protein
MYRVLLLLIIVLARAGIGVAAAQSLPTTESAGALSAEGFKAALKPHVRPVVYQRLPAQFRAFDLDHSGYLEASEYDALAMIRDAGVHAPPLAAADTSKDARIDFREFVALAAKMDPAKAPSASPSLNPAKQERTKRRGDRGRLFHMQVMAANDYLGAAVD